MATPELDPVALLVARSQTHWFLDGSDAHSDACVAIAHQAVALRDALRAHPSRAPILLLVAQPQIVIAWLSAAVSAGVPIFLGNPHWTVTERDRVVQAIEPGLMVGPEPRLNFSDSPDFSRYEQKNYKPIQQNFICNLPHLKSFPQVWGKSTQLSQVHSHQGLPAFDPPPCQALPVENSEIFMLTGGSSGELRFACHRWRTLLESVAGLRASGRVSVADAPIDSFCLLPLYHVSGLMQWVRSLLSRGNFAVALGYPPPELPLRFAQLPVERYVISLVPTQLQRMMQDDATARWLARFHCVFLGGAPAWPSLLQAARAQGIALAPTYGMTETASQVVTLSPPEFEAGQTGCGRVLPHAQIEIGEGGAVRVRSRSLAQGYLMISASGSESSSPLCASFEPFPQDAAGPYLPTDDLGFFDPAGSLHIVGRSSDKIISGGENIFPAEVEAAIQATGLVTDVVVLGVPDADWGERVVAVYTTVGGVGSELEATLRQAIAQSLCPAKRPKTWVVVAHLPRNAQGKLHRQAVRDLLS